MHGRCGAVVRLRLGAVVRLPTGIVGRRSRLEVLLIMRAPAFRAAVLVDAYTRSMCSCSCCLHVGALGADMRFTFCIEQREPRPAASWEALDRKSASGATSAVLRSCARCGCNAGPPVPGPACWGSDICTMYMLWLRSSIHRQDQLHTWRQLSTYTYL